MSRARCPACRRAGICSKRRQRRLRAGEHGITPFHWQIEFPEVFARDNGGFDAIVGNPPFRGQEHDYRRKRDELSRRGCKLCTKARMAMPILSRISSAAPSACCGRGCVWADRHEHHRSGRYARLRPDQLLPMAARFARHAAPEMAGRSGGGRLVVHIVKGDAVSPVLDDAAGAPHLGLSGRGRSRYARRCAGGQFRQGFPWVRLCSAWASPSMTRRCEG